MFNYIKLHKKVVLLGDPAVGKTSMIRQFVFTLFDDKYVSTLGTKVTKKSITYDNLLNDTTIELNLMIWDVMGQSDYKMFHTSACGGSQGALIVCDISRHETVENLSYWKTNLYNLTGQVPIIMIGNKNDLAAKHKAEIDIIAELATVHDVPLFFTSAKTGESIEKVFFTLGESILRIDYKK
jgi:small GTP-binding protein